jgi:DNA polymerase III delta prime subunit
MCQHPHQIPYQEQEQDQDQEQEQEGRDDGGEALAVDVGTKSASVSEDLRSPAKPVQSKAKPRRYVEIDTQITCIADLLRIVDDHTKDVDADDVDYNIDVRALAKIRPELAQIDAMIGLASFKTDLLNQLLYFMQDLHCTPAVSSSSSSSSSSGKSSDYKHMVLYGPPGTGKTQLAKLVGAMYAKLGILPKNVFRKVTRTDLVAGYLGQTAIKTKKVVEECLGGCLFIDEVYALGNGNGTGGKNGAGREDADSYSKECIDTLCEALSDHKDDLMVIVAGYKTHVQNQFFGANPGLESRFIWQFELDEYTSDELCQIFLQKVADIGWSWAVSPTPISAKWFEGKKFPYLGRDMEMMLTHTKIAHGRRVYGQPASCRRRLTLADVDAGHALFLKNQSAKGTEAHDGPPPFGMYV